ncbi:MAG TPA: DUF6516 family protein [Longimicrobiaceae bacterium]|nr:DUF6516 family protein [Longimicrobiaceae bacterium]
MDQVVRGAFVTSHDLRVSSGGNYLTIEGDIHCAGGIVIEVNKRLEILAGEGAAATVQTAGYRYHVRLPGKGTIFRYDSPHPAAAGVELPAHHPEHHVHRYDVLSGDVRGTIEIIYDIERVPTLREVIDEAAEWFYRHAEAILGG